MLLAAGLIAAVALVALGVWRPAWFLYGAIFTAPLHVYRRPLPDPIGSLHPPDVNFSLFRLCVLAAAAGLAVRLVRMLVVRDDRGISAVRQLAPFIVAVVLAGLWVAYESTRSLWSLGDTVASAYAFFFLAVVTLALGLVLGTISPKGALGSAAASAVLPLLYAMYQYVEPGTNAEKYNTPVLFSKLLDAPAHTDLVRAGTFRYGAFRPAATFSDPNFLAVFAAGTVMLADPGDWVTTPWRRWALHAIRVVAAFVVLGTKSRTGLIILAAYLDARYAPAVARGLRQMARSHGQVRTAVLALAATAVVALGAVAVAAARRAPESTSAHETTVRQAVSLWRQFPVEGAGLANFGYVHGQPPDRSSAQSFPFTILAEQGLIGLLVVSLVFWGPGIRLALRDRGLEATPLAMVFLVGGWFYDFPLALDVCAVWLGILVAAFGIPALGLPPARIPAIAGIRRKRAPR